MIPSPPLGRWLKREAGVVRLRLHFFIIFKWLRGGDMVSGSLLPISFPSPDMIPI
jgi:hypothetical protein